MASVDELWLVDFGDPFPGEPASYRPALVIGPPATFGSGFPFVIVVPLTTKHRDLSLHVEIEPGEATGLVDTSYVQCELIRSVSKKRLVHRLGVLSPTASADVASIIRTLLDY